jgi:hypothetical protein
MEILVPSPAMPYVPRKLGRDTVHTINTKPHWETLLPEAPRVFEGASDSMAVSPPLWNYCPGGYQNQWIGMCVGCGSSNGTATVLRIPPNAVFDPADPTKNTPRLPNVRLSALYNYFNARNVHGNAPSGDGAVVGYAMDAMQKFGVILEAMWQDTQADQEAYSDANPPSPADYAFGAAHVVLQCARITSKQMMYDYLASGFPVVGGFIITQGWLTTAHDGAISLGGPQVGGHCVEICGYDRNKNETHGRGSWQHYGEQTSDPEFNSDDPAYFGNAGGYNNHFYAPMDQFEALYLNDAQFQSGETDMFVVTGVGGFTAPLVAPISASVLF